jgi:hypothetical protein
MKPGKAGCGTTGSSQYPVVSGAIRSYGCIHILDFTMLSQLYYSKFPNHMIVAYGCFALGMIFKQQLKLRFGQYR